MFFVPSSHPISSLALPGLAGATYQRAGPPPGEGWIRLRKRPLHHQKKIQHGMTGGAGSL
jgi:hypothetical protein